MKRLLLAAVLMLASTAALAQAADRDVLLTSDGTLYTVESITVGDNSSNSAPTKYLQVTAQNGTAVTRDAIAETKQNGINTRPSLAYDAQSKTLFVFWIHMPTAMSSEIAVATIRDGKIQPAVTVDESSYHFRSNLSIGITRRVAQIQQDGSYLDVPALLVHAVWWEETGAGGEARYALMSIEKGQLSLVDGTSVPLKLYVPVDNDVAPVSDKFNREILKHPAVLDNGTQDSVDVVFGDNRSNMFRRVTLQPHADARVRIPVGAKPNPKIFALADFSANWTGPIVTMISPTDPGTLLLANAGKDAVSYILFAHGQWSGVKSVPTGSNLSTEAAMAALSKMVPSASE
jgi:hypothetical protein